jgi:hypothetical protein
MPDPGIMNWIKSLSSIPQEAKSAGAGLSAAQQNVDQYTGASPSAVPVNTDRSRIYSQDLNNAQGPYGSRPGELRLDSQGNPISGFSGVKHAPQKHSYSGQ